MIWAEGIYLEIDESVTFDGGVLSVLEWWGTND